MNRMMLLLTAALMPGWAGAVDIRGKGSEAVDKTADAVRGDDKGSREAREQRDWAEKRLEALREDFDRYEKRMKAADAPRREEIRDDLSKLKERVSTTEGRIKDKVQGDEVYREVEDEIDDIRDDFRDLRRKHGKR